MGCREQPAGCPRSTVAATGSGSSVLYLSYFALRFKGPITVTCRRMSLDRASRFEGRTQLAHNQFHAYGSDAHPETWSLRYLPVARTVPADQPQTSRPPRRHTPAPVVKRLPGFGNAITTQPPSAHSKSRSIGLGLRRMASRALSHPEVRVLLYNQR